MRYYLIKSRIQAEAWETIIGEYDSLAQIGKELIQLEGGKMVSQYIGATESLTFTTIQFSGSPARLLYKLLSIGIYEDVELTELVHQSDFQKMAESISAPQTNNYHN